MTTALIATTLNCKDELERSLDTICRGDNLELVDRIVVVDGGSTDGSREILEVAARDLPNFETRIVPGANISEGRNRAIERAEEEIIVGWDTGCEYPENYLELMLAPFRDPAIHVVGARTIAVGETAFERGLMQFYDRREVTDRFSPSHRAVAYRRVVWERVGGYPEHVQAGEDTWFNTRWRALGMGFELVRQAEVRWRVRASWMSSFRMARRNTRGHVELGEAPGMKGVVTAVHLVLVSLLIAAVLVPGALLLAAALYAGYTSLRLSRRKDRRRFLNPAHLAVILWAMTALDLGTTVGMCEGWIRRVTGNAN